MSLYYPPEETIKSFTFSMAQAAATYDICSASAAPCYIESVDIYVTVAGATFTSLSIQTDDTTPLVVMSAATGAVANLTAQSHRAFTTPFLLNTGKKIQATLVGATGTGTALIVCKYKPVTAGGRLV